MSKKLYVTKRSIFFFLSLCFCATLIVFRSSIFHFGLTQYIAYKMPLKGKWHFSYGSLALSKDGIAFYDVEIKSKELGLFCDIGTILCNPLSKGNQHFSNYFSMNKVQVEITKKFEFDNKDEQIRIADFLHLLRQLEIKSGDLTIDHSTVSFYKEASLSKNKVGKIALEAEGKGKLLFSFASFADQWVVDVDAKVANLSFYKHFAEFFLHEKSSVWKTADGQLDGKAFFAISFDGEVKDARVHMNVLNVQVTNEQIGISASSKRLFLDANYPTRMDASFIENLKVSSSLEKAEVHIIAPNGESRACFKDLSGYFTLDSLQKAEMEISGYIDDEGRKVPITFCGKPKELIEKGLDIDVTFQIDPLFGNEAKVNFSLYRENEHLVLGTSVDSLEVKQVEILQQCIALFRKDVKDFAFDRGVFSGDMSLSFDQDGVQYLRFSDVYSKDLSLYCKKNDIHIDAKTLKGKIDLEWLHQKSMEVTNWSVDCLQANVVYGRENNTPIVMEDICGAASCKDGDMVDSFFSTKVNGANVSFVISGTNDAPIVDMNVDGPIDSILEFAHKEISDAEFGICIDARIEKQEEKCSIDAIANLTFQEKNQEIEITGLIGADGALQGSCKAEGITTSFTKLLKKIGRFSWELEGEYDVEATLEDKVLSLDILSSDAKFIKEHSYIKHAKGKGLFVFDFNANKWRLDAKLTEGRKKLFEGKELDLSNACITYCNDENFFSARDVIAKVNNLGIEKDLFLKIDALNFYEDGRKEFDLCLEDKSLELVRLKGEISENEVHLDKDSHLMDKSIDLQRCHLGDGFNMLANLSVDLSDYSFPKFIREKGFGDTFLHLSLQEEFFSINGSIAESAFCFSGNKEGLTFDFEGITIEAKIKDQSIVCDKCSFSVEGKQVDLKSLTIDREKIVFDGSVKEQDNIFKGTVEVDLFGGLVARARGVGSFKDKDRDISVEVIEPVEVTYNGSITCQGGMYEVSYLGEHLASGIAKQVIVDEKHTSVIIHGADFTIDHQAINSKSPVQVERDVKISLDADVLIGEKDFWVSGSIDQQQILFQDKKIDLKDIAFRGNKKAWSLESTTKLLDSFIGLQGKVYLEEYPIFHIDGLDKKNVAFTIDGRLKEGVELYRIKGELLDCFFDISPVELGDKEQFFVDASFNFQEIRDLLPKDFVEFVDALQLKKGISLLGTLDIKNTTFDGVIKGENFDVGKYSLNSLFGSCYFQGNTVTLSDFSVADPSMIMSSKQMEFTIEGESCKIDCPKFTVEDFRPCLLSEKGKRAKLTNPFVIKHLELNDIYGDLANFSTLQGKGRVKFINAFMKKENPIFGFAKEIIGRIGLDPVLMIPITGEVDFTIANNRMNLIKLYNSYSDAKRSFFYFWHKTNCFVDFDGNMCLDIRMKQHALFKFAELFIISIEGNVSNPKVSLK